MASSMRSLFVLSAMLAFIIGCSSKKETTANTSDVKKVELKSDTSFYAKQQIAAIKKVENSYDEKLIIDTVLELKNKSVQVHFEYLCLKDSILTIPSKYYELGNEFSTYEFSSKLEISSQDQVLFDGTITKRDFKKLLTEEILTYGTLRFPSFRGVTSDSLELSVHYTIGIPGTDLGTGVTVYLDEDGNTRIGK